MHFSSSPLIACPLFLLGSVLGLEQRQKLGSVWDPLVQGFVEASIGTIKGTLGDEQVFDYVVIGGGTAGNTVGYRLAEAGFHVAIVERGLSYEVTKPVVGAAPLGDIIGVGSSPLDVIPTVDYGFITSPQPGAAAREMHYAQGKALGGSSALNFMIHHRPNRGALDRWAELVDDASYGFDAMLPYFQKPFTFTPPNTSTRLANATTLYQKDDFASDGGPIEVTYPNWTPVWSTWAAKGLEAMGINATDKYDEGSLLGWFYAQLTVHPDDQTRCASDEFIYTALHNGVGDHLTVYLESRADKILFDANKTATAVQVTSLADGVTHLINATQEIILSAGALHSPQLLMLSGVGPAEVLSGFGIDVVADRPGVGQNLTDHVLFGPSYEVVFDTLDKVLHDPVVLSESIAEYAVASDGPLTTNVAEFLAFERLPAAATGNLSQAAWEALDGLPSDWPHVEYFPANGYIGNFSIPWLDQPADGKQYVSVLAALVAPQSRGRVSLASGDPSEQPVVDPQWLTDETDVEVAVAGYQRARALFATEAVEGVRAAPGGLGGEYFPGGEVDSYDEVVEQIRRSAMTVMHASCTNRMGTAVDPTAVVDSRGRVLGVVGLRVVDASALALLPPGHPQALVYALAEKIAEDVVVSQRPQ